MKLSAQRRSLIFPTRLKSALTSIISGWLMMLLCASVCAQALPISYGQTVTVAGQFAAPETNKDKDKFRGVSGLACRYQAFNQYLCLTVNDEERFAEWAVLNGQALSPTGKRVQLISEGDGKLDKAVGQMPAESPCDGKAKFGEFDGEAIAIDGVYFYVIGSHACSRKSGKFRPSSFLMARGKIANLAMAATEIERSWRVSEVIMNSPLKEAFALVGAGGAGIEGLAVVKGTAYLGFRTPVKNGKATILAVDVQRLFAVQSEAKPIAPEVITLALGAGVGIRDLAALPDGRLLILSGPAQEDPTIPYVVHVLSADRKTLQALAQVRTPVSPSAKAEALAVLEHGGDELSMLVTYDNIHEGGPRMHTLTLK